MTTLPDSAEIVALFDQVTNMLARGDAATAERPARSTPVLAAVQGLHITNFRQWNLESDSRDAGRSAEEIACLKRAIEESNQCRYQAIEALDREFETARETSADAVSASAMSSETLGEVVDRLSVLSLRVFHAQLAGADENERAAILSKRDYLARCLDWLVQGWLEGSLERHPTVVHHKAYVDSRLER